MSHSKIRVKDETNFWKKCLFLKLVDTFLLQFYFTRHIF